MTMTVGEEMGWGGGGGNWDYAGQGRASDRSMNLKGAMSGRPRGPYTVKKRSPVQFRP